MWSRPLIFMLAFLPAVSGMAHAHGVFHEITRKEAVVVTAGFDDGEPASFAQVKIFSPGGGEMEHQNGRTDKNGRFAFLPDLSGEWKISIDAGMGHKTGAVFVVGEETETGKRRETPTTCPRWRGVFDGLSLIFGLCGFIMYFRAKRLLRRLR